MEKDFLEKEIDIEPSIIEYYKYSKKMFIILLVCFLTFLLAIPIIVAFVFQIVWLVKSLTIKTNDNEIKDDALLFSLLSVFLIGFVGPLVVYKKIENKYPNINLK